jgi:hypothetical protein
VPAAVDAAKAGGAEAAACLLLCLSPRCRRFLRGKEHKQGRQGKKRCYCYP